ncbi:MAG TPA: GNAT family protein, partial [Tepidisphaeraceae bacterium]|nr:GNAT family protein [Tepidisphaeraceae bacterium]
EIGYWIRTSLAGGGYASEAVAALTRLAFDSFKAARVEIQTDELNTRSRRVAERAGFVLEGILRNQYHHRNGELRNACVYSRIAAQPVGG